MRLLYQQISLCQDGRKPCFTQLSCCLGGVSSYPTMELAFFMSGKLTTRVHRKTVHSEESGHRLRLVKQMQQISLVERSKLKCLAHSVQSPKKWFLCLKKEKRKNQQDTCTRQQQKLVATSPWSGFMWGIKQGGSCT